MKNTLSFRFLNADLNRRLIALLKKKHVKHRIDKDSMIHYSADDEELVENDLIGSIRKQVFPSWQVLSCPTTSIGQYERDMSRHDICFQEELSNGQLCFLIPRSYRPHSWKLETGELAKQLVISGEPR